MTLVFRWTKSMECSYCERRWPPMAQYRECPACREPTHESEKEATLTEAAAKAEVTHAEFGWYLWDTGAL